MLPIRNIAINVNYVNGIIYFKNGYKYLLCDGCVIFFIFLKNKQMAGIKDIEKI